MSSILKALKKIEENSPSPEPHPSLPKSIDTKQLIDSNIKSRRRRRRAFYMVFILLLLAGAAALLFNQRQMLIANVMSFMSSESPTSDEASSPGGAYVYKAKMPASPARPAQDPPSATRQLRKPMKKTVPGSADKNFQANTKSGNRRRISEPSSPPISPHSRTAQPVADSRIKKPLKKASTSPSSRPAKKSAAGQKTIPIAPAAKAKQPTQTRTQKTYRPLEGAKLKLQALAWSDDAARRMAVINGRIVHEGDSVDGYQIQKIREEDVIVMESGKSWSLAFGLQQ